MTQQRRQRAARAAARGFTLLEIAIAIALMAIVVGTCVVIMAQVLDGNRRAQAHSELMRDGTFVSELLNSELRQAGLGVPADFDSTCGISGAHIRHNCDAAFTAGCQPTYGTRPGGGPFSPGDDGARFYGAVLVAAANQVGVVGDLPRPDSQYSAYGPLHNRAMGDTDGNSNIRLMWHNENNGSCAPGNSCTLSQASTFFADGTAGQVCGTGNVNGRTCPWGMRRMIAAERLQIIAGDGGWSNAAVAAGPSVVDIGGGRLALTLNPGFDLAKSDVDFAEDGVWANRAQGEGPGGIRGTGWVTTLDRVFFFHDNAAKTLSRIQCMGDPDPNNANWPSATATTIPGLPAVTSLQLTPGGTGGAANTCIGPEVVARNVDSVTFSYFNRANASLAVPVSGVTAPTCPSNVFTPPLAGKSAIRRIDYVINFKKAVDGNAAHDVRHSIRGSVRLQNL